jgi:hypothetical protein
MHTVYSIHPTTGKKTTKSHLWPHLPGDILYIYLYRIQKNTMAHGTRSRINKRAGLNPKPCQTTRPWVYHSIWPLLCYQIIGHILLSRNNHKTRRNSTARVKQCKQVCILTHMLLFSSFRVDGYHLEFSVIQTTTM